MYVKETAMSGFRTICDKSVRAQVKLGESYSEVVAMNYVMNRYRTGKTEYLKWKRMMHKVAVSDMKMNTLLDLVFYKVMREGGLFDDAVKYFKEELVQLKKFIN